MRPDENPAYFGRMNDPTCAAWIKGQCGDTMEVYLVIEDEIITNARYHTDGCGSTHACALLAMELCRKKSVMEALGISPKTIIDKLNNLPYENYHCAILAVTTLHKAIADYLLKH